MKILFRGFPVMGILLALVLVQGCSGTLHGVPNEDGGDTLDGGDAATTQSDGDLDGGDAAITQSDGDLDGGDAEDNAAFVSQDVSSSLAPGASFLAQFTMRNTGTTTWSEANRFRLGSDNPQDNVTWSTGRIQIEGGVTVAPNDSYTFTANLTAPATPGSYTMQWRMVHEQVTWFGESTGLLTIQVVDVCANHCSNGQIDCGEIYIDCGGSDCAPCEPIELADATARGGYVKVVPASPGKVMVVWHKSASGNDNHIRWTCFDGQAWSPTQPVTAGTGGQEYPWMVSDSLGRFHLVHNDGGADGRRVHYNVYDASDCSGQWHNNAEVLPRTSPYSASYPSVSVDENDDPYVTWSQSQAQRISPFPDCGSGCAANNHCYLAGNICIPDYEQHFSRRTGGAWGSGSWTSPVNIAAGAPGTRFSHHGTISVVNSTTVHAVWMHGDPSRQIYYSQFNGTTWSQPEFTGINAHMADVQADAQDAFVFADNAESVSRPALPFSGAQWSSVTDVSGGTLFNFVKLKLDQNGRLHAVWNENYRIAYSMTNASGNWRPVKYVSPAIITDTLYSNEPSVEVDSDGNVHIVWSQSDCPFEGPPRDSSCEFGAIWYLKTHYNEIP